MDEPTVYLTVCDWVSPWYLAEAVVQKPHRNTLFYESRRAADGFRGRVSQVRILPGPLPELPGNTKNYPSGPPSCSGAFLGGNAMSYLIPRRGYRGSFRVGS